MPFWGDRRLRLGMTADPVHVHDLQATILHLCGIDHEPIDLPFPGPRFPPNRRERQSRGGILA